MHQINIQIATLNKVPSAFNIRRWMKSALLKKKNCEMTIRIVDTNEMKALNFQFRKKNMPTNVLSFPADLPKNIKLKNHLLGDIVICNDVVKKEANTQQKPYEAHFAHMVIHGTLHLLGYDHVNSKDANKMESLEIKLLNDLGFPNPYIINQATDNE